MFWIIILPLNILYYPTNESIRFSNNLIFLTVLRFIVISATFCQVFAGFSPAFGLGLGAVLGISAVSATFSRLFSGFLAEFGSCFGDFCCFSYFFSAFFPAFWLSLGSCFGDFCSFSYFLPAFLRLLGWVWGAVLGISAVSATFCRLFSGFWAEFGLFLLHLVGTKS